MDLLISYCSATENNEEISDFIEENKMNYKKSSVIEMGSVVGNNLKKADIIICVTRTDETFNNQSGVPMHAQQFYNLILSSNEFLKNKSSICMGAGDFFMKTASV